MYKTKGKNLPVLDITVKGKDPLGKYFAPTWDIVMDLKNKIINEEEYTIQYHKQMVNSYKKHKDKWEELLIKDKVVLICFCGVGKFCHRYILAEYLVKLGATYEGELI